MFPPKFDYYRAGTVAEALSLLAKHNSAKLLAGGHSLIPAMNIRLAEPGILIDIGRVSELKGISSQNGAVRIGAMTTHAALAESDAVPRALSEAAGKIGDPQVRNRGTIGGSLAHADPGADLPIVVAALDAKIHLTSAGGNRVLTTADFFTGILETALQEGEIVVAIEIPSEKKGSGSAYAKLPNPASRYAMVGVAAAITLDSGRCAHAGVAVGGLTPQVTRASAVESVLVGKTLTQDVIAEAAAAIQGDLGDDILEDIHAGAEYRRSMAAVFAKRALTAALERASAG